MINYLNTSRAINIDLGFVYSISLFYAFIVYGGFGNQYWFVIAIISLYYFSIGSINKSISINLSQLCLSLICCLLFFIFNNENAKNSLVGDHLYHVSIAYAIPLKLIHHKYYLAPEFRANFLLWIFSIGIVGSTILLWLIYERKKHFYCFILATISVLVVAISIKYGISNLDPHPPLRSYVLALIGFFGVSSTNFRIQGLIPLIFITYYIINQRKSSLETASILVFTYTIPVLYFNSLMVEFSIWAFAILAIYLIDCNKKIVWSNNKIIAYAVLFTLAGLVRQTAAFGLILLCVKCLQDKNLKIIKQILIISIPAGFQISKSLINGNPATYIPSEVFLDIPTNLNSFQRIWFSLSIDSYKQIESNIGVLLILPIVYFLLKIEGIKKYKMILQIVVYFALYWGLFHVIRPILWGVPRYQLEYIAPMVVMGFYFAITCLPRKIKFSLLILIPINLLNITVAYNSLPSYKIDYPEYYRGETPYFSEVVYNYEDAIIKNQTFCNNKFYLGASVNEAIPLVLAGLNIQDVGKAFINLRSSGDLLPALKPVDTSEEYCYIKGVAGFDKNGSYNKIRNTSVVIEKYIYK